MLSRVLSSDFVVEDFGALSLNRGREYFHPVPDLPATNSLYKIQSMGRGEERAVHFYCTAVPVSAFLPPVRMQIRLQNHT